VCVFLSVCYYCFFSDCRIYLFSSLAARVFNKLTCYLLRSGRLHSRCNWCGRERLALLLCMALRQRHRNWHTIIPHHSSLKHTASTAAAAAVRYWQ